MYLSLLAVGRDPNVLYGVRFEPGCFDICFYGPLQRSDDGGATWGPPDKRLRLMQLWASPLDSRIVYGLAWRDPETTLQLTTDSGTTWAQVPLPRQINGGVMVTLDRRDSTIAYVKPSSNDGQRWILVTRDGGATWTELTAAPGTLAADPLDAGRVYLFASDGRTLESRDAARTWVTVDSSSGVQYSTVVVRDGQREAVGIASRQVKRLDLTDGALALGSDLWWNPAESGIGLTITQHPSNNPFVVWYGYDTTGAPTWRVVPGGQWNDRTFTGQMYETSGPPYFHGAFDPSKVTSRAVGTTTLRFDDENNAQFSYSLTNGISESKRITRQQFGGSVTSGAAVPPGEISDLWWNENESGWGIGINAQSDRVFATWYVYGDDGKPLWIVMPDSVLVNEFAGAIVRSAVTGDIYTTRGPAAGLPFDPSKVVATKVGTATLHFDSDQRARLEYTAFGRTETRTITRQPF